MPVGAAAHLSVSTGLQEYPPEYPPAIGGTRDGGPEGAAATIHHLQTLAAPDSSTDP